MKFIVADTETAGLEGGVCDIAIVELDEDLNIVSSVEQMTDPERPISPAASGIHHITNAMVENEPTLGEFMELQAYPLDHDDLVICGHNIQFDCRMLAEHLPKTYRRVCTLKLARDLWPDLDNHQLQTIRYTFGLEAGPAHRAMGDVITCISFLRHIAKERNIGLTEIIELARKPMSLESKLTFGKHKGTKLKNLPLSYVQWLLNQANPDPDLREALAQRIT